MRVRVSSKFPNDPIKIESYSTDVEIRIGAEKQGQSRYAKLTASQAKQLAYALLHASEAVSEQIESVKEANRILEAAKNSA